MERFRVFAAAFGIHPRNVLACGVLVGCHARMDKAILDAKRALSDTAYPIRVAVWDADKQTEVYTEESPLI